jgi:hypothetical protein
LLTEPTTRRCDSDPLIATAELDLGQPDSCGEAALGTSKGRRATYGAEVGVQEEVYISVKELR